MNDNKLKDHIEETFDKIVPDVLSSIKADPNFRVPQKNKGFSISDLLNNKTLISVFSILVIGLILVTSVYQNNPIVASTVTIDVNPSLVITLDEDDFVIGVVANNDDGVEIIDRTIKYRGLTVDEVVDILIEKLAEQGYIITTTDEYNIVLLDVESDSDEVKARVEQAFKNKINAKMQNYNESNWIFNSEDIKLSPREKEVLKNDELLSRMSKSKLIMIYRLKTLQDQYNIMQLSRLSIRQLYDLLMEYENPDNLPNYNEMPGKKSPHNYQPHNGDSYSPNAL